MGDGTAQGARDGTGPGGPDDAARDAGGETGRRRSPVATLVAAARRSRAHWPAPVDRAVRRLRWYAPERRVAGTPPYRERVAREIAALPEPSTEVPVRVLIGPANFAGQGHAWARALDTLPGVTATSYAVRPRGFDFPVDYPVDPRVHHRSRAWQKSMLTCVENRFTHVVVEAGRALFGELFRADAFAEAAHLRLHGIHVALLWHGTDVRLPSRHARTHRASPFADTSWPDLPRLEARARRNLAAAAASGLPNLVSTPDLLDELPDAAWCPVVVDVEHWACAEPVLERAVPVVLHLPSNGRMKSTPRLDAALRGLAAEGLVEYVRPTGVRSAEVRALVHRADVVLDQFRLGSYGVAACEAMAAGRVVVGHVTPAVRARVRELSGHELPVLEAQEDELDAVLRTLLADRAGARVRAEAGRAFVGQVHDGRRSARVLREHALGGDA